VVADGSKVDISGVGRAFGIDKVYYMPEAQSTLISMQDLMRDHRISQTETGSIVFYSKADGTESWRFEQTGGLYKLADDDYFVHSVMTSTPELLGAKACYYIAALATAAGDNSMRWYRRGVLQTCRASLRLRTSLQ
jgi:hypothetical protein